MTDDIGVAELTAWAVGLEEIHARIAPRFARSEPRERVAAYVRGLLAPLERKNGWTLADENVLGPAASAVRSALTAGRSTRDHHS